MKHTSHIIIVLFFSTILYAQEIEFGEITDEELQMTSIEADPEADVVILFDIGRIAITQNFKLEIDRHIRIKILTEAGKEWADISLGYRDEDKIYELEAASYLPNGDDFELDDDDIFEEEVKNYKYSKFAIPGVEVGSVLEYKYSITSKYIRYLEPWYFQDKEFTKLSRVSVLLPTGFNYSALEKNWNNRDIKKTSSEVWNPYRSGERMTQFTWTGKDIPAIRKEPYMHAFHDYYAQILFQLVSYKNQYVNQTFAKSWKSIAENNYDRFNNFINAGGDQLEFIEKHITGITDPLEKAKKIFEYVRSDIETTSGNSWWVGKEPEEVFEDKKGTPSNKNTLLMNLLNHAGLKVEPLLISTKSHGSIFPTWAQTLQFNRTIVFLTINKKKYFLDTASKFCPFGYLTPNTRVGVGFLMKQNDGKIVKIKPMNPKNRTEIETNASLENDGTVTAESKIIYKGFTALAERENIDETENLKKYIENKIDEFNVEAEIDTFYYSDVDSIDKPVNLTIKYKLPAYSEETDGLFYFIPPFLTIMTQNPYERDKREFPVDYSYKYESRETLNLVIPDDYTIAEKPKTKKASMRKLNFSKVFFGTDKKIECRRSYTRKRNRFSPLEYQELRATFDKIVESDQDLVLLQKK